MPTISRHMTFDLLTLQKLNPSLSSLSFALSSLASVALLDGWGYGYSFSILLFMIWPISSMSMLSVHLLFLNFWCFQNCSSKKKHACVCVRTSGPFNQIKSSLLGSTSDSNLTKYSTINKIPLITLNFSETNNDKRASSPHSSEKTIIAPKVKDRTHNVTEKVTQVRRKPA